MTADSDDRDYDEGESFVDDAPIFYSGQNIQWQLADGKHDVCPMCNVGPLEALKKTVRTCTRCMVQFRLMVTRESWERALRAFVIELDEFYEQDQEIVIRKRKTQ